MRSSIDWFDATSAGVICLVVLAAIVSIRTQEAEELAQAEWRASVEERLSELEESE